MGGVSLTGYGRYLPERVVTGAEIAEQSDIPEDIVVEKMGLAEKRVCPPDGEHCTGTSSRPMPILTGLSAASTGATRSPTAPSPMTS